MSCCGEISVINRIGAEELSLEWRIKKFLSLPGGRFYFYESPRFKFCDTRWRLRLYPYKTNEGQNPASRLVSLILIKITEGPPKTFRISVGIRGSNGVEKRKEAEKKFTNTEFFCEWEDFCWTSELGEHKARLMPDNILAVTCVMKVSGAARVSFPARHGNVISSLKSILAEGKWTDFTLKSRSREWPVHRAILEGRSGYFETLFRGEWAERDEARFGDVAEGELDGVLHFIYAGEVGDMSVENVCEIYVAAHELLLEDLKSLCVEYMKEKMCPEMVCVALAIAEAGGEGDLKESALECFFRESNRTVATEGWKKLKENHPAIIGELFEEFIKRERKNRRKEQD